MSHQQLHHSLNGNVVIVFDMVDHADPRVQAFVYREKFGEYLTNLKDKAYRDHVFAYIERRTAPEA